MMFPDQGLTHRIYDRRHHKQNILVFAAAAGTGDAPNQGAARSAGDRRFRIGCAVRRGEAVKRNAEKFPADLMFVTTAEEFEALRSQIATSNEGVAETPTGRGGRRYLPRVFTEHGALMAATVLNSPRAVEVSIYVVRAFVELRELANTHQGLAKRLDALEEKTEALAMSHDTFSRNTRNQIRQIFDALRELAAPPEPPKRPIGFLTHEDTKDKPKGITKAVKLGRSKKA